MSASSSEHVNKSSSSPNSPSSPQDVPQGAYRPSSASPVPPSAYQYAGTTATREGAPSRSSRHSEGYPSWLPRRPPPPAPASTIGTSTPAPFDRDYVTDEDLDLDAEMRHLDAQYGEFGQLERPLTGTDADEEEESPVAPNPLLLGGRKPTPRSVRIVNLERAPAGMQITEEPRAPKAAAGQGRPHSHPSYATSYAYWKGRQNRVSSGSTAVAHPGAAAAPARGWARANNPQTMFNSVASSWFPPGAPDSLEARPRPRFNTRGLHLELLRSPSQWMKVYYRLWPFLVLAHLPIQSFLDFNTVYMLIQASKHPLPNAAPSSSKNWALGAGAYIACWLIWILAVFVIYEIVYSFARRWRVRRPLIFPLYISSPGYTYACMTSFNTFCFLQHLRWTAFVPISPEVPSASTSPRSSIEDGPGHVRESEEEAQREIEREMGHQQGHHRTDSASSSGSSAQEDDPALGRHRRSSSSPQNDSKKSNSLDFKWRKNLKHTRRFWSQITWRDGLAETFNLYSQNLPNIVTLLPRAGLALGLLLTFSSSVNSGPSTDSIIASRRDSAFFDRDGMLSGYAEGILWANVAWTAWRVGVLLVSWTGLWILSGHTCAGICGPRDKWEEEELHRLSASLARSRRAPYPTEEGKDEKGKSGSAQAHKGNGHKKTTSKTPLGPHKRKPSWYSMSSSVDDDDDVLPWQWRECTRARVQDAWEFCVVGDGGRLRWGVDSKRLSTIPASLDRPSTPPKGRSEKEMLDDDGTGLDEAGLQRVLAAVGFPTPGVPTPAKRGVLRKELFEAPSPTKGGSPVLVPSAMLSDHDDDGRDEEEATRKSSLPLLKLPYPFTQQGSGYVSSKEGVAEGSGVPFPAVKEKESSKKSSKVSSAKTGSSSSVDKSDSHRDDDDDDHGGEQEGPEEEREPSSSSHNYSSESGSSSSSRNRRAQSNNSESNSMSSLGNPIAPTSAAFVSRGFPSPAGPRRQFTVSGGTAFSASTAAGTHGHGHRSSIGSAMTNITSTSGGIGGTSGVMAGSSAGTPLSARTRFPFISGPPAPSSPSSPGGVVGIGATGPSTHFGVHGRRVTVQHTGGTTTSGTTSGHSRGLSHASGFSGLSNLSTGVASDQGYAASGSGEGDVEMEIEEEAAMHQQDATITARDRTSSNESAGSGVIPMPRRHPQAGRTRVSPPAPASGASSESGSRSGSGNSKASGTRRPGGIAFPTSDGENTTTELGMVTGYASGRLGMEMLSIEASDSLARRVRERAARGGIPVYHDSDDDHDEHEDDNDNTQPRAAGGNDNREEQDNDDMYVDDDDKDDHGSDGEGDLDEEAEGEREDRVGLLSLSVSPSAASLHHSPRSSVLAVDQLGQLLPRAIAGSSSDVSGGRRSRRSSAAATSRRSRESLGASPSASRSRHSSYVRSNRTSLAAPSSPSAITARRDSLLGAARSRASSFGVRVRERAQSLMQSVVGGVSGASASPSGDRSGVRERTTSEVSGAGRHRRLGSGDASMVSHPAVAAPPVAMRSVSGQSGESSGSSGQSAVQHRRNYGQLQHLEDDYSSSGHSRNGSVASHGENYTFGRPIPFLNQPEQREDVPPVPELERHEEVEETVPSPSAPRERTTSVAHSSSSFGEEIFYSPTSATPLQSGLTTPVPRAQQPTFEAQQQQPEEGSPDLPWAQRLLQPPEQRWVGRDRSLSPSSNDGSGSGEMMLSSAAESFVTAPADARSMLTMTTTTGGDSSEAATLTGSWEERRGSGFVGAFLSGTSAAAAASGRGRGGRRESGMVERVGEDGVVGRGGLGEGRVL